MNPVVVLPLAGLALFAAAPQRDGVRDRCLRALVCFGLAILLVTESLSAFDSLTRARVFAAWMAMACAATAIAFRRGHFRVAPIPLDGVVAVFCAGCALIFALTFVTAIFSPPNSADAMAYHLPRVLYWAEQRSVRFFPTPYLNQIMLQPFAEYAMLQSYVLSGGDRWTNLGQWAASAGSAVAVACVAREFGAAPRAQALAALFCAALPSGILASSGAKNDYVLALWLIVSAYFALRWRRTRDLTDATFLGCSLGLALLTKATAYLFAPWPLVAILVPSIRQKRQGVLRAVACVAACAFAINLPHYIRNWNLSGSPLGYSSAFGNDEFRWSNDQFGWRETLSNALRHASEQLGGREEAWNRGVYNAVVSVHRRLGVDPNDPHTTWQWATYRVPKSSNHEADAPNRMQLAILAAVFTFLLWRAARGRDRAVAAYALSLVLAFLAFCAYLKWQPFMGRMFLPLFVLSAPLVSLCRPLWLQVCLFVLLMDGARRPATENWTRPLRGPSSIFVTPRDRQYFSDMTQWREDWPSFRLAVEDLKALRCEVVGVDISRFQLEYPLEALVREALPSVQFAHVGVINASARYRQPMPESPCAEACLKCSDGRWVRRKE